MSNTQEHSQRVHHMRHSLRVDVGDSRTGVAISLKGYAPRPLSVLQLKGDKLIASLLQIASKEKADEFIVGLPISFDGKETSQSSKTKLCQQTCSPSRSTGYAVDSANCRGWRVYLFNEYGSSQDELDYMLDIGIKKSRKEKLDACAALVLLHSYFGSNEPHLKLLSPGDYPFKIACVLVMTPVLMNFECDNRTLLFVNEWGRRKSINPEVFQFPFVICEKRHSWI